MTIEASSRPPAAPPAATTQASLPLLRRLVREFLRPYFGRLGLALLCMAVMAGATAANAWLMQPMLDRVFVAHDERLLLIIPAAVIVLAFLKGFANYGQTVMMTHVGQRVVADIQSALFARIMRADLAYFHENPTGTLISRFTLDAGMLRGAATDLLASIGREAVTAVFLMALMFYQDWVLALLAVVVFPIAFRPIISIGRRMRRISVNTQVEVGLLMTLLNQCFQGARHVKAYGMESYEISRARDYMYRLFKISQRAARIRAVASPLMETLGGVAVALVILYGGHQVLSGTRTPGAFFSFITALLLAYQPMKSLAGLNASMQEGLAAAQRIFTVLDIEPAIRDRDGARPLRIAGGEIRFDKVRFGYMPGAVALDGVSLIIPAGR
ncbi:MAG TPA: ABC transporter ATP-binding protein, partial [Stellaceae bacterium]|nr:ABC transporter ATP-binding protein [Stellaceae bacterium]